MLATLLGADTLMFLQGSSGGTLFHLMEMLNKHYPGEGYALIAALMAGGEPSVTARQSYDLFDLSRIAAGDATALAWLRQPDRNSRAWQRELPAESQFRQAFANFLQRYGHRAVYETYLRNPRWREAPDYLFDCIAGLIGSDPAALRRRQQQTASDTWQRLRRGLPWWKRAIVAKLLKSATAEFNHREAARSALMAYQEGLRRMLLALGQRMSGAGGLEQADDIFNLTMPEILALAEGRLAPIAAARRATERRAQLAQWAQEREPDLVTEHHEAAGRAAGSTTSATSTGTAEWQGTVVGGGCSRGRAHIAHTPADGLAMAAGDVLVAPSTDPAWTPLFLKAGALVMETGGYLSHGAIVAREFGIPAVVNLPGILQQLQQHEWIEVDGNGGRVRRVPSGD
jgi:pyruvate,water dikinase